MFELHSMDDLLYNFFMFPEKAFCYSLAPIAVASSGLSNERG